MRIQRRRRARGRGSARPPASPAPRARASRLAAAQVACGSVSAICWPTVITGSSEYFGSCSTMAMRWPRSLRKPRSDRPRRSMPSKSQLVRLDLRPGRPTRPRMARPVVRLARAAFADDAQPLAAEREADAAHGLGHRRRRREGDAEVAHGRAAVIGHAALRVEHVAQPVAQQVEAQADDEDGEARDGRHPPLVEHEPAGRTRSSRPIPAPAAARRGRGSRGPRRSG